MVIQIDNGAVLELFWRYRGLQPWSRAQASALLSRYRRDPDDLSRLRILLARRIDSAEVRRMPDSVVLDRLAILIASDELMVAEYEFRGGWSGSFVTIGRRTRDAVALFWRHGIRRASDTLDALVCLSRIKDQEKEVQELRKRFEESTRPNKAQGKKDSDFVKNVETFLESGELIAIYHWPNTRTDAISGTKAAAAPSPERSAPEREDAPDPSTFSGGHDVAGQVATLQNAAKNGVPFCEVCQQAAQSGARQ